MIAHVVENFLPDAQAERALALGASYQEIKHNGLHYRGISLTENQEQFEHIATLIGAPGKFECFWRRYLESEESETYIHTDCDIAKFTAILFLSEPKDCRGGIAFWRHKLYGWELHPTREELTPKGIRDTPEFFQSVYQDGFDEFKWEMVEYVPMGFNRLVLFDARRFHSRFPKRAFGTELENARLIKTFFYTSCEKVI